MSFLYSILARMTLTEFKWLAALIILSVSLLTGFASIAFATRHKKQLEIGDAIANGIFIGAALFHLFPSTVADFQDLGIHFAYVQAISFIVFSFIILWLLEKLFLKKNQNLDRQTNVWLLTITLSIHALIAGTALGLSDTLSIASILFIAIIVHKGFETFAFVINVYRQLGKKAQVGLMLTVFSLVTPVGILFGIMSSTFIYAAVDKLLTAFFTAFAAGTFLYIGALHSHYLPQTHVKDNHHQYVKVIATMLGIAAMMVLSIWV